MQVNFSRCELGPIYRNDDGTLDITIEIDDADIEQTLKSLSIQCGEVWRANAVPAAEQPASCDPPVTFEQGYELPKRAIIACAYCNKEIDAKDIFSHDCIGSVGMANPEPPEPDGIPPVTCAHGKGCHNCIDVTDFHDAQPPDPDKLSKLAELIRKDCTPEPAPAELATGTWMPPTVRKWLGGGK